MKYRAFSAFLGEELCSESESDDEDDVVDDFAEDYETTRLLINISDF